MTTIFLTYYTWLAELISLIVIRYKMSTIIPQSKKLPDKIKLVGAKYENDFILCGLPGRDFSKKQLKGRKKFKSILSYLPSNIIIIKTLVAAAVFLSNRTHYNHININIRPFFCLLGRRDWKFLKLPFDNILRA